MDKTKHPYFIISILISLLAFILFAIPNNTGAKDYQMLSVFEPDEFAQYPVIQRMITPKETLRKTIIGFLAYDYYFYGFPFFGSSAIVQLLLKGINRTENTQLSLLFLRQLTSVLPMLISLLLLVKLWDNFETWRSPFGLLLLLNIPAVTKNALWWHPDGLVLLLVVLILYLLRKDSFKLKRFFYLAAILCGVLTATKLIGLYFFLAVAYCLWMAYQKNKLPWPKIVAAGIAFIALMAVSFVAANPFLLSSWGRIAWFQIFQRQRFLLDKGYGIVYEKGLLAVYPLLKESYGHVIFLLTALAISIWGAIRSDHKHLYQLTLTWSLPITIMTFFLTHFKYQYWLPVGTVLISGFIGVLPKKLEKKVFTKVSFPFLVVFLILLIQSGLFIPQNIRFFRDGVIREETSPEIAFAKKIEENLAPLDGVAASVYFDYRLYLPENENWQVHTSFDLLNYDYINDNRFDVLLLLRQRINDYLNPDAVGIDPQQFQLSQSFYTDAENGTISGYKLIYQDELALIYIKDKVYYEHFGAK